MSNGLGREVGTELGTNHAAVPMGTGYLPPDHSCPVGLATRGCGVAEETEKVLSTQIALCLPNGVSAAAGRLSQAPKNS